MHNKYTWQSNMLKVKRKQEIATDDAFCKQKNVARENMRLLFDLVSRFPTFPNELFPNSCDCF